jgi:hypothetical protein
VRKEKRVSLGDRELTVRELTIRAIRELAASIEEGGEGDVFSEVAKMVSMCTSLSEEEALELAPSELKQVWQAVREVNADFFELASELAAPLAKARKSSTNSSASS